MLRFSDLSLRRRHVRFATTYGRRRRIGSCPKSAKLGSCRVARNQFQPLNELWRTRRDTIASSPAYFCAFEDADRTAC